MDMGLTGQADDGQHGRQGEGQQFQGGLGLQHQHGGGGGGAGDPYIQSEHNQECEPEAIAGTSHVPGGGLHRDDQLRGGAHQQSAADWKLFKRRGIIPDGLVQSQLSNFLQSFPNLRSNARQILAGSVLDNMGSADNYFGIRHGKRKVKLEKPGGKRQKNVRV